MRTRLICIALLLLLALPALAVQDFTFVHVSDVHYPYAKNENAETIAALPQTPIQIPGTTDTVPAPAFAIATGDLNEFGGGSGGWEGYLSLWKDWKLPLYNEMGNHDNTWDCSRARLEKMQGSAFYAFEYGGVKFIGFDTCTPQDPRPSAATEGLEWLTEEFKRTPAEQPVIFFCHHPLTSTEFASTYARDRLLQLLQTRNVVVALVGHGHSAVKLNLAGIDAVEGGSAYGPTRGYSVISIKNGTLRVWHQYLVKEPKILPLLEKRLPTRSSFLQIRSLQPADGAVVPDQPLAVRVTMAEPQLVKRARWVVGDKQGGLTLRGESFVGEVPAGLEPGAHALRIELVPEQGPMAFRSVSFWVNSGPLQVRWAQQIPGQCQAGLIVRGRRLYVASNDGNIRALDVATGQCVWCRHLGGEVRGQPALLPRDGLCVASSNGLVCALNDDGSTRWTYDAGAAVYSSLAVKNGRVLCANNAGAIVALSVDTGAVLWRCDKPEYAIESGFAYSNDTAYTGSWDGYVYALALADGNMRWRALSRGSNRQNAARYYSPADAPPVWAGGNIFVADRGYSLTILRGDTGAMLKTDENASAVAAASDGNVYVQHCDGRFSKRRPDGSLIWEAKVPTGYVPTQPVEADGRVWVISSLGTLSMLDAATGALKAQYQAGPDLFMFASPAARGNEVYVVDEAGHLLALTLQ